LPLALIESELFGHEKGAFTGAMAQKKGKFELAHKGTLFLDEIGELSAEAQAKLLRALQDGEIVRVGGERTISVDVRLITATNRNLEEEIKRGKFRQDLYYRLKVVELKCPALRERLEDLPALAQHFIEHYARKLGKGVIGISPSALTALSSYDWPGNVRELENLIARAVALATTQVLGPQDFALLDRSAQKGRANGGASPLDGFFALSLQEADGKGLDPFLDNCERRCLEAAMQNCKTQKEAADALRVTPTKLHRLLKKHGMIARIKNF
jgi:transcriptional regulator with GAF, ATPase, and Fis domain